MWERAECASSEPPSDPHVHSGAAALTAGSACGESSVWPPLLTAPGGSAPRAPRAWLRNITVRSPEVGLQVPESHSLGILAVSAVDLSVLSDPSYLMVATDKDDRKSASARLVSVAAWGGHRVLILRSHWSQIY